MGPWNRHSVFPRQADLLIDAFRVACGLGVAVVGGYHLTAGIIGGRDFLGIPADDIIMAPITASCLLLANRQRIVYFFPPTHRSDCDVPVRQRIAHICRRVFLLIMASILSLRAVSGVKTAPMRPLEAVTRWSP